MSAAYPFLGLLEAVKLYLLASYTFLPLGRPLPLLQVSCAILGALAISRALSAAGGRRIYHLLAHALGLSASFIATFNAYRGAPLLSLGALPAGDRELIAIILVAGWVAAFYFRGLWLGSCAKGPRFCVARFDEGVAAFLFALALAAATKVENAAAGRLAPPFFLFSSVALTICRLDRARRGGLSRRPRRLLIIPVAAAALIVSAGIAALSPLMFDPAARLGESIRGAAETIEPYIERFLRWLFGFYSLPVSSGAAGPGDGGGAIEIPSVDDPKAGVLTMVLLWLLGILAAAALALTIAYGLRWLIPRLFAKVERRGGRRGLGTLRALIRRLLGSIRRMLPRRRRGERSAAVSAYAKLLHCGRGAGAPRKRAETPREYAGRLSDAFPDSASGALAVVDALEREAYGLQTIDRETERKLGSIRGRLRASSFHAERAAKGLRKAGLAFGLLARRGLVRLLRGRR